jgi:hypothetical protein
VRRLLSVGLVAVMAMLAACSGASTNTDPYQLLFKARTAGWDQVQIDLSVTAQTGSDSISLAPGAVRLVLDTKGGKGLLHLSIPTSVLGSDATSLIQLGVTGSTIDVDLLYDGQALYAKSPLAPALVTVLFASSGGIAPTGDLTGWLKLATAADFASLAALGGAASGGATASAGPFGSIADATAFKAQLTDMGIALTYVGTEQHNGTNADHVSAAVDWQKLAASPALSTNPGAAQLQQGLSALKDATLSVDLWLDHGSGRFIGLELKGASKANPTQTFDVAVSLRAPDPGTSLDAPASFVEVPLMQVLGPLVQQVLRGGLTP